jgi:hypothetical protein
MSDGTGLSMANLLEVSVTRTGTRALSRKNLAQNVGPDFPGRDVSGRVQTVTSRYAVLIIT